MVYYKKIVKFQNFKLSNCQISCENIKNQYILETKANHDDTKNIQKKVKKNSSVDKLTLLSTVLNCQAMSIIFSNYF